MSYMYANCQQIQYYYKSLFIFDTTQKIELKLFFILFYLYLFLLLKYAKANNTKYNIQANKANRNGRRKQQKKKTRKKNVKCDEKKHINITHTYEHTVP